MSDRSGLGHHDWSGLGWQSLCPADLIQQSRSLGVRQTKQHKPKQRTSTACKAKQDKAEANQINGWPNQSMTAAAVFSFFFWRPRGRSRSRLRGLRQGLKSETEGRLPCGAWAWPLSLGGEDLICCSSPCPRAQAASPPAFCLVCSSVRFLLCSTASLYSGSCRLLVREMRSEGGTTRWRRSCPHGARPRPSARQGPCRLWPSAFFGPTGYSACSTSLINWRASQPCSLRLNWASMGSKGFKLSRGLALKQGTTRARAQGSHRLIPTKH